LNFQAPICASPEAKTATAATTQNANLSTQSLLSYDLQREQVVGLVTAPRASESPRSRCASKSASRTITRTITIREGEFIIVPRGVEHKPVADEECWVMLFEPASTLNTGNAVNERTVRELKRV
jgi:hypothetical protein